MLSEVAVEEKNGKFTKQETHTGTVKNITMRFKYRCNALEPKNVCAKQEHHWRLGVLSLDCTIRHNEQNVEHKEGVGRRRPGKGTQLD
jgi:hypothetical protein